MKKILVTVCAVYTFSTAVGCFIMFLTDGKNILVANHEDRHARDAEVTFVPASGNKYGMVYFDFASEKRARAE